MKLRPGLAALPLILAALAGPAGAQPGPVVDRAFRKMDANRDGVLTQDEWIRAGRKAEGFKRVDADGDGRATLEELRAALAQLRARRTGAPG